ncbi:MAG: SDR family oxidoreductase [Candidatus Gygaella obscura]|nr:SDR family oxidoreductase [Candidatus Gygaella obscura]
MSVFLVTGGAGFIGSHIVERLVKQNHTVKVLDNFVSGKEENLSPFLDKIELIKGDIRDEVVLSKAVKGCDYILHQAALRSVPKSMSNPQEYHDVNVTGTLKVLLAARDAKVKRVVFASSSSVYGETNKFPQKEDFTTEPISPYATTKLLGEYYCNLFAKSFGLDTFCLRYFNVFGPRQSLESLYAVVVPKFITSILDGKSCPVHGDGSQSRDFTFVGNVVDANIKAALCESPLKGESVNIASGRDYTVLELIKIINQILNTDIKPDFIDKRPGDVQKTNADISKAAQLIKYIPLTDFKKGLEITASYFKENLKK